MELFQKPAGVQTRWASFENPTGARGAAAQTNRGAKGDAFRRLPAGESVTLLDVRGSGVIRRIWLTVQPRTPFMLRSLRIDMYWDDAPTAAVSAPLGDFFGVGLGACVPFASELFANPEGRSFNCFVPMPFRTAARIVVTNESEEDLSHLFYDVNYLLSVSHGDDALYFHTHWRRESPNALGEDFTILPHVSTAGRFLGANLGVITNEAYADSWWGEGEVKVWLDGDDPNPTLCGSGAEDYVGTGWGLGRYSHATQGCLVADAARRHWAFYRYHTEDPIYFDEGCRVAIQTIGGTTKSKIVAMQQNGVPLIPVSIDGSSSGDKSFVRLMELPQPVDLTLPELPDGWCNFYRRDDWSSTAYFYLDGPENGLPQLPDTSERTAALIDD